MCGWVLIQGCLLAFLLHRGGFFVATPSYCNTVIFIVITAYSIISATSYIYFVDGKPLFIDLS